MVLVVFVFAGADFFMPHILTAHRRLRYNFRDMKTRISFQSPLQFFLQLPAFLILCLGVGGLLWPAPAQEKTPTVIVLDDFENGVSKWSTNDSTKTEKTPASLIDILPTSGTDLVPASRGGGLFTFKAAKGAWASASLRISGVAWQKIGARQLTFFLNAGGNQKGVEVLIRRVYKSGNDEVFRLPLPVRLQVQRWRKVAIPLGEFKSDRDKKPLPSRLEGVYLLQFVMRGDWDARFFTLDQLQVEGTGVPIGGSTPEAPAEDTAPGAPATPGATSPVTTIAVDFLRATGRLRAAANVTVGASRGANGEQTFPFQNDARFSGALRELKPQFVRLDAGALSELTDSNRPAFDFRRLKSAVIATRAIGAQPLIVVTNPKAWTLDSRSYTAFAAQAARAANERGVGPARYFELATGDSDLSDANVVAYYNAARAAIKKISSSYRVGGVTASAGRLGTTRAVLRSAKGLDFFVVQDFSAWVGKPDDAALLKTAREVSRLKSVAGSLEKSKWKNAALFVVGNLSALRVAGGSTPADERTVQMVSGAWWATYLASASRVADQVFHNESSTPEWGLLDEAGRAYPAYYAMWLWNTFVPPGSTRVRADTSNGDIAATALNTATAHNLLLVNNTPEDRTAQIGIRGFPVLRQARIRIYDDPRAQPRLLNLPKSPYQTIELKPYATAIVQFIEPPR
jgi:hypothetical protein